MKKAKIVFLGLLFCLLMQAQTEKKLLPHTIKGKGFKITYSYDDNNRFTTIRKEMEGSFQIDSVSYFPNDEGYVIFKSREPVVVKYKEKTSQKAVIEFDSYSFTLFYLPSGKVSKLVTQDSVGNSSRAKTIIYRYDRNENIIGYALMPKGNDDFNRTLQMMAMMRHTYDDKKGIFKNVNLDPSLLIYDFSEPLPYYLFFANNILKMEEPNDSGVFMDNSYTYNGDGYPVKLKRKSEYGDFDLKITYINAK